MPIRPELRKFYSGPTWRETRRSILERAGGRFDDNGKYLGGAKCERCKVNDRDLVNRIGGFWWDPVLICWRSPSGDSYDGPDFDRSRIRTVAIVLTLSHSNHTSGDDRDDNLLALCQWCHLNYDKLHHRETRCKRKDSTRPLLQGAAFHLEPKLIEHMIDDPNHGLPIKASHLAVPIDMRFFV